MDLRDKTVAVTGAAHGLGREIAEMLAHQGAKLALIDLDDARLQETRQICSTAGIKAESYAIDVTDGRTVEATFNSICNYFGGINAVISCAGMTSDALLVKVKDGKVTGKLSEDKFNKVVAVDLRGVFLCGREAAVHMVESGQGGVIINISSISRAGNVGQTNYSAAKAGVSAMTVTWAKELARHNIRVAGIAPGFCNTRMVATIPAKVLDHIVSTIPLRRLAAVQEIAQSALFILQNEYYTGRILEVDGGLRI